jgi:ribosome-binding factor A
MAKRPDRVASLLKQELADILMREYADQTLALTTVTEVRVSPDLRIARVYISVYGDAEAKERTMEMLDAEKGHIRALIGARVRLRFTPDLQFVRDDTLDRVERINTLIKQIHRDEEGQRDDQGPAPE